MLCGEFLKFRTLYVLKNPLVMVIMAIIAKMLVRIANREDPDQTASSYLGLHCLFKPFWQVISVQNFRTVTIPPINFIRV